MPLGLGLLIMCLLLGVAGGLLLLALGGALVVAFLDEIVVTSPQAGAWRVSPCWRSRA